MRVFRSIGRLSCLLCAMAGAAWRIAALREEPSEVIHVLAQAVARIMGIELRISGSPPVAGLVVANHLSYVDVVALAAAGPSVFVAKSEVARWPLFGWFARRLGCIFAERGRPARAGRTLALIEKALGEGRTLVLFPEGTSSGGEDVLLFRSSLLQAAVGRPITVAALGYSLDEADGDPREVVCYWRDMTLVSHLMRLLTTRRIGASLAFSSFFDPSLDRKRLAAELRSRVLALSRHHAVHQANLAQSAGRLGLASPARLTVG